MRWWLVALVVVIGVHRWIPETRWLMVHMVTLGLITTSIMVWSQHFTEALLHHKLPDTDRPRQIVRIYGVTAGTVLLIAGMLGGWWWLTVVAATVIGAMLTWHGLALLRDHVGELPKDLAELRDGRLDRLDRRGPLLHVARLLLLKVV